MTQPVRVVNMRKKVALEPGEVPVSVDRTHPDLGNPFVLRNPRDRAERDRVCDQFERMADNDMRIRGPIYRAVRELAGRVRAGERLALRCWCAPDRCHADWIAARVLEEVARL